MRACRHSLIHASIVLFGAHPTAASAQRASAPPACEWCGAAEAPAALTSTAAVAPSDEPGERLEVSGRVFRADGRTPMPGVLMYVYHTNARGQYARLGGETGNGLRHGHLRGWLRTGPRGEYRIATIRPAPYPGRAEPAHVHMTLTPPGGSEGWVDSILFDDDPLLTPALRARLPNTGGSGIVRVSRDARGVQHAVRDVVLAELP